MKTSIIHIINQPPPYLEYKNNQRPKCNWNTSTGSWVGIWGYDWADQIAIAVSKFTNSFKHEIWQLDYRADKIYVHEIYPGVVHKLFPAKQMKSYHGIKNLYYAYSKEILLNLSSFSTDTILHLHHPIYDGFNKEIVKYFKGQILLSYHGIINLPINQLFSFQRDPLKKISYLLQHFNSKKYFKLVKHITYMNNTNFEKLRSYYKGSLTKLTMGVDTNKFKVLDKAICKQKLKLPDEKKILLTVSRLNSHKQIDKIIEVLSHINGEFIFVIVGQGTNYYESYLRSVANSLMDCSKIRFEGYKVGDELIEYLNSADVFINVSKSEGSSVAVMEAMACGLPIICTDTGNTAEVLKEYNAGRVMGIKSYNEWESVLSTFINGDNIKTLDIEIVKKYYDWTNIANKFIEIYNDMRQ